MPNFDYAYVRSTIPSRPEQLIRTRAISLQPYTVELLCDLYCFRIRIKIQNCVFFLPRYRVRIATHKLNVWSTVYDVVYYVIYALYEYVYNIVHTLRTV